MKNKSEILQTLRSHAGQLASEFGVRRIGIFGSCARDEQREGSDVDVLAELERPLGLKFVELATYLESLLGTEVDVLTPAGLEAIRNPRIIDNIRRSLVYA